VPDIHRRSFLKASGAVWTAVVAGCSSSPSEEPTEEASPEESTARDEATTVESARVEFGVELVAEGFHLPWAVAFLPGDTRLLVTERRGTLNLVDREDGTVGEVTGTPQVFSGGQGGLLDLAVHPAFPEEPWVYLTYTAANGDGESTTHLGRGHLDLDDPRLDGFEVVHVAEPFVETKGLYGSRVVFGADDLVYVTVGSRSDDDLGPDNVAQDPGNELGATLRLEADGVVPDDNPFVEGGGADAVFSYGHRNAQGMTVHPGTGALWQSEHGEKDGDELNMIEPGGNYGWPVADYGCTYEDGAPIGDEPHERDDVVDPVYHWACGSGGFPPSGMTFYDGDAFPGWRGDLFVGNLAGQYLGRFAVDGRDVAELDPLLADRGWRVRDVAVAPESGHLYVVVDDEPVPLVRLVPEGG
jgi:glucose/arabinose dehydrogenase